MVPVVSASCGRSLENKLSRPKTAKFYPIWEGIVECLCPFLACEWTINSPIPKCFNGLLVWFRFETMAYHYPLWDFGLLVSVSHQDPEIQFGVIFGGSLLKNFKRVAMELIYMYVYIYIYIYISPTFTMNMSQVSCYGNLGSIRYLWLFHWQLQRWVAHSYGEYLVFW